MDANLRREIILDNYQNPFHKGLVEDSKGEYIKNNTNSTSCIDNIDIMYKIKDGVIEDIYFDGEACAISTSATSIMIRTLIGKTIEEAKVYLENHEAMIREKPYDKEVLKELNIVTAKEILLYLPTWGQWSSIERFSEKIGALREKYFVITKPHHCTARLDSEKNNRQLLNKCSDMVLNGNYDFTKAITVGDVLICDALSGAAVETVYLRENAKVLFVNAYDNGLLFEDVYDLAKVINNPDELSCILQGDIKIPKTRADKLKEIFGNVYDELPNDVIQIFRGD